MFGVRYVKSSPSHYLMQFQNGKVVREGTGLAFFYFAPKSTLVSVPLNAVDIPFMFEETTRDFIVRGLAEVLPTAKVVSGAAKYEVYRARSKSGDYIK